MTTATTQPSGSDIWDKIYAKGHTMWYPSEALVRLVRRQESLQGFPGTILDHGCGAGNVAEFLIRSGHRLVCTEISKEAIKTVTNRLREAMLAIPEFVHISLDRPLAGQLPHYDHAIAWHSILYNVKAGVIANITDLIHGLPRGGVFIFSMPTMNDLFARASEPLLDGSRRFLRDQSGQLGATLTIPQNKEEMLSWCAGIEVRDVVTFGMTFNGEQNEYWAVYGVKK